MSKAKYEAAEKIFSVAQFEQSESDWFKWRGKTTRRSWLISLQYRTLKNIIDGGVLYEAKLKQEATNNSTT